MQTLPVLTQPVIQGRDVRIFPGVELEFFTVGDVLVPVQRGEMVRETGAGATQSYWRIIPQLGKVWREPQDGDWSRAAFPVMLVNDTENHAHQGLATFLYRPGQVSGVMLQFIQQTGPYLIKQYFVAWGFAPAEYAQGDTPSWPHAARRRNPSSRIDCPRSLVASSSRPCRPEPSIISADLCIRSGKWPARCSWAARSIIRKRPLPMAPYPYPLEMRFGVRSVTKSVFAPLALLRLRRCTVRGC